MTKARKLNQLIEENALTKLPFFSSKESLIQEAVNSNHDFNLKQGKRYSFDPEGARKDGFEFKKVDGRDLYRISDKNREREKVEEMIRKEDFPNQVLSREQANQMPSLQVSIWIVDGVGFAPESL